MAGGVRSLAAFWIGGAGSRPASTNGGVRSLLAFWMGGAANNNGTPPVTRDTGGSGHKGSSGRRRNLNDDPDAFAELLKEWRERRERREGEKGEKGEKGQKPQFTPPNIPDAISGVQEATSAASELLAELRQATVSYDRAMAAYEAALVKLEQVRTAKAKRAAIALEEQARQMALQQAIEWELARLAYEDFLDDEDDVMLLTA